MKGIELSRRDLRKAQDYFYTSSLARMWFRLQNRMLDIPADMKGHYLGRMGCEACLAWRQGEGGEQEEEAPIVTAAHLEVCPGYGFLREGKEINNSKEKAQYFIKVMKMMSLRG